jgi:hypothetical protein
MEQRRVRLGDIVDDYCTRERRLTNHAVVAMVEDQIQLTRCTTCDAEHPYKGAKVPRRRKKGETGVLYDQVLAGRQSGRPPDEADAGDARLTAPAVEPESVEAPAVESSSAPASEGHAAQEPEAEHPAGPEVGLDDGPVRRPLIRATLPRPEGQPTVRPAPEFTIRQSGGRGGFRPEVRGNHRNGRAQGGRAGQGGHPQRQGSRSGSASGRSGAPFHQTGSRQDRQGGRHHRPSHARSGKKRSH